MTPIDIAGLTLLHFVWQGTLIGGGTAIALNALRHQSPQLRYAVACASLAFTIATPVITAFAISRDVVNIPVAPQRVVGPQSIVALAAAPSPQDSHASSPRTDAPPAPSDAEAPSWLATVVALWLAGVVVLLTRFAAGWWCVHRLRRQALLQAPSHWAAATECLAAALGIRTAIRVVDSMAVDTPTVIGWLKPVVVLPIAAFANLTPTQVEAILAHELAHIRRHDSLVNLGQTLAETLLFYHPAVWWISARIRTEREHCCDEIAACVCGDPVVYAEALVELERWRTTQPVLALAATGGPLLARIRRLLGVPDERPRGATAITIAGVAAILVCLVGTTHYLRAAQSDSPALTPVDSDDAAAWHMVFNHDESQMRFLGFRGRDLVRFAYQVPSSRVLGGPSWMDEEILRLVVSLEAAPRADEMPDVVRRVLEDRLHLRTHIEQRNFPVLALVTARADGTPGPNLRESTIECFDFDEWVAAGQPPRPLPPAVPRQPVCGEKSWDTPFGHSSYVAITMKQFADRLRHDHGWPTTPNRRGGEVVDRTGLTGRYDLDFAAFAPAAALMSRFPALTTVIEPLGFRSLPHALEEQLGLTLIPSEAPFDVIVIDSADQPGP
jgi:uncharacterized protein (TIGR03435 family)